MGNRRNHGLDGLDTKNLFAGDIGRGSDRSGLPDNIASQRMLLGPSLEPKHAIVVKPHNIRTMIGIRSFCLCAIGLLQLADATSTRGDPTDRQTLRSKSPPALVVGDFVATPDIADEASVLRLMLEDHLRRYGFTIIRRKLAPRAQARGRSTLSENKDKTRTLAPPAAQPIARKATNALLSALQANYLLQGLVSRHGNQLSAIIYLGGENDDYAQVDAKAARKGEQVKNLAAALARKFEKSSFFRYSIPKGSSPAPRISYGELIPFGRAAMLRDRGDLKGAAAQLQAASPHVTQNSPAARTVALEIGQSETIPSLEHRLYALLLADPRAALRETERLRKAVHPRRLTKTLNAIDVLAQTILDPARISAKSIRRTPMLIGDFARAEVFRLTKTRRTRFSALEAILAKNPYLPALMRVANTPLNELPSSLAHTALKAGLKLSYDSAPALVSRISLRAASAKHAFKIPFKRVLKEIRVDLLTVQEIAALRIVVDKAIAQNLAIGFRLRAELDLFDGRDGRIVSDLNSAIAHDPDDLRSRIILARYQVSHGQHTEAAATLKLATGAEDPHTRLEYAQILELAGESEQAQAIYLALGFDRARFRAQEFALDESPGIKKPESPSASARDVELKAAQIEILSSALDPLLKAFPPLRDGQVRTIVIRPSAQTNEPAYWPLKVHRFILEDALIKRLKGAPFSVLTRRRKQIISDLTLRTLNTAAAKDSADAVMVYSLSASGISSASVRIVLFQTKTGKALAHEKRLSGRRSGLVSWNPPVMSAIGTLVALGFAWLVFLVVRGYGDIRVRVISDSGAAKDALSLVVSRAESPPTIGNADEYATKILTDGPSQSRWTASGIRGSHRFRRMPAGDYYVHLYGALQKGGTWREVRNPLCTKKVVVKKKGVESLTIDLDPAVYELSVQVYDAKEPVPGATIWLEHQPKYRRTTGLSGSAELIVPRREQCRVIVRVGRESFSRNVKHDDARVHSLAFNLERERRLLAMEGGIALEVDRIPEAHAPALDSESMALTASTGPTSAKSAAPPTISNPPNEHHGLSTSGRTGTIERYQRVAELGRGAMGIVYKARDSVLERDVAIKVIGEELRQHPTVHKMFMQEAKALAALNHPNIVTVYDQGQDGLSTFLVMEFVEGNTLQQRIESGALPLSEGLKIADNLCAGLAYAHARKIIHRDIKPDNIFLATDGRVKIGDFGLARVIQQLSIQRTEVKGTPLYMAPEQIRGTDIDLRADIYALGCTLFAIFTGRPPFIEGEILYHHIHSPPPKPSSLAKVPELLDEIILACIAKTKEDRIATVGALRQAIRPLQGATL